MNEKKTVSSPVISNLKDILPKSKALCDQDVPLVSLKRVSKFYAREKAALFDVSLDVYSGEFIYVAGASGAGKTTLLKLINAAELPDTGTFSFFGYDLSQLKSKAITVLRRCLGVVFQDFHLIENLTVSANVGLPLEIRQVSPAEKKERTNSILKKVGLENFEKHLAGSLSGGEKQRVAVARALIAQPELILADEPTGSLDAYNADYVFELFEQAAAEGVSVILATHDQLLVSSRPHKTVLLDKGRVVGISVHNAPEKGSVKMLQSNATHGFKGF